MRCTLVRCTSIRYTPMRYTPMKVFARTLRARPQSHICPLSRVGCVLSHIGYVPSHGLCAITYGSRVITLGYVLSHMGCSHRCSVLKAYLGRRTACLGTSAHRPCFDLSVCLHPVCLSPDSQSDCLRFLF